MASAPSDAACLGSFDLSTTIVVIIVSCVLGICWAAFNFIQVRSINVVANTSSSSTKLVNEITEEQSKLLL
jgi:hypothetical protein